MNIKEHIIENHKDSDNYAVLVLDLSEHKGYLKYYSWVGQVQEIDEFRGEWFNIAEELINKAVIVCKNNNCDLWSY